MTKLESFGSYSDDHGLLWIRKATDPNKIQNEQWPPSLKHQGPAAQKPIKANPRLKINQGVHFSIPKFCSTLIVGKTFH